MKSPASWLQTVQAGACSLESEARRHVEVCNPQETLLLTCSEFGACSEVEKQLVTAWLCGFCSKQVCDALIKKCKLCLAGRNFLLGERCRHQVQRLQENGLFVPRPHL